MGYRTGAALVFTDLCVFRLDQATRELVVIETMPGITQQQIRDATGFAVTFAANCREIPMPSSDTLAVLRNRIDPLGLRRLEFISAKERGALIAEILATDHAMVERCIAAQQSAAAG
jgi:glutaconate CoA-transferase subunit A